MSILFITLQMISSSQTQRENGWHFHLEIYLYIIHAKPNLDHQNNILDADHVLYEGTHMSQLTGAPLKTNICTASKTAQLNWPARLRPASDFVPQAKTKTDRTQHYRPTCSVNVREEHVHACDVSSLMAVTPFCCPSPAVTPDEMARVSKGLQISRLWTPTRLLLTQPLTHTPKTSPSASANDQSS